MCLAQVRPREMIIVAPCSKYQTIFFPDLFRGNKFYCNEVDIHY